MSIFTNSAEAGVAGTTPTTSDSGSGNSWSAVQVGPNSVITYDTAHPAKGSKSYRIGNHTATVERTYLAWDSGSAQADGYHRAYFYLDGSIAAGTHLMAFRDTLAGNIIGSVLLNSAGKLVIWNAAGVAQYTGTTVYAASTQYRVEARCFYDGTKWTIQVRIYSADSLTVIEDSGAITVTPTGTPTVYQVVMFGRSSGTAANWPSATTFLYLDALAAFGATWLGPIGGPPVFSGLGISATSTMSGPPRSTSMETAMFTAALGPTPTPPQNNGTVCNKNTGIATRNKWSQLKTLRIFNSGLPSTVETGTSLGVHAAGFGMLFSAKPPIVPDSTHNTTLGQLAATLSVSSDWFTTYHEPENDMTGAQFRTHIKNTCDISHAANPGLRVGYVAMAYQWRPGTASTTTPDDWWTPEVDFLGCDVYFQPWEFPVATASTNLRLDNHVGFMRWYNWAKTKNRPLHISELGFALDYSEADRAAAIDAAEQWLLDHGFVMVMHWNADTVDPYNYMVWGEPSGTFPQIETVLTKWFAFNNAGVSIPPADMAATSTVSGTVRATHKISGVILAFSMFSGAVIVRGAKTFTASVISATSTVNGSVRPIRHFAGGISASSTVSGAIKVTRRIAPTLIAASSTVSGSVAVLRKAVSGVISASSIVSGKVVVRRHVTAAQISATSTVAGALVRRQTLQGGFQAISTVSGRIAALRRVTGGITATSTLQGSLRSFRSIRGQISSTSILQGSIRVTHRFQLLQINAISVVTGGLQRKRNLGGAILAPSTFQGTFAAKRRIAGGLVTATSTLQGRAIAFHSIRGAITAFSAVTGSLTKISTVSTLTISAPSTFSGRIRRGHVIKGFGEPRVVNASYDKPRVW